MRRLPLIVVVLAAAAAAGCAARAQAVAPEPELPILEPPPPPPRVVSLYVDRDEPLPVETPLAAEPAVPSRPAPRPSAPTPLPEPAVTSEEALPVPPPPALTLSPALGPGAEAKTEASIRALLARVSQDLGRVNPASLSADGRTQLEATRRFVQQAEDALKVRNLLYAGKLADKAATMAAVLAR